MCFTKYFYSAPMSAMSATPFNICCNYHKITSVTIDAYTKSRLNSLAGVLKSITGVSEAHDPQQATLLGTGHQCCCTGHYL
jgi:hypothetical protein